MTDRPRVRPTSQFGDPTTSQDSVNCTSAAFCNLGQLAAGIRIRPGTFRSHQRDRVGGIGIHDGAVAWQRAFPGVRLNWAGPLERGVDRPPGRTGYAIAPGDAWDLLVEGAGMVVQTDNEVFDDAGLSLQRGFRDGHSIYLDGTRTASVGRQAYRLDPLGRGGYDGDWVSWDLVVRAATKLSGGRGLYAAWARPERSDRSPEEEDMPTINFGIERWELDGGPGEVTTLGGPRLADGETGPERLAFMSDAGGANLRLELIPRERLTRYLGRHDDPRSQALAAGLATYSLGRAIDHLERPPTPMRRPEP